MRERERVGEMKEWKMKKENERKKKWKGDKEGKQKCASNIEQVLEAALHKAAAVRPLTTHHENYPS